jgi:diadenosine tetraphosphate (Ap4A) HIT family hydrolase
MSTPENSSMKCDFCAELSSRLDTHFHSIYAGLLESRISLRQGGFAALPTVGQLFEGSYLVIPTNHVERYADLASSDRLEALQFVDLVEARVRELGRTFIYEHGARCESGAACGIYHAHIHVVPLPRQASCEELLGFEGTSMPDLQDAWHAAAGSTEYLLVRDSDKNVVFVSANAAGASFGSQFMRRRLVQLFNLADPWDWREYRAPESRLLRCARLV